MGSVRKKCTLNSTETNDQEITWVKEEITISDSDSETSESSAQENKVSIPRFVKLHCTGCKINVIKEKDEQIDIACSFCNTKLMYQCIICNTKSSDNYEELQAHMYMCNNGPNISCDKCPFVTFNKSDLVSHLIAMHPESVDVQPYQCTKCHKAFKLESSLIRHVHSCNENLGYKCQKCNYVGKTIKALYQHKYSQHSLVGNTKCVKCGKIYKNVVALRQHSQRSKCSKI